MIVNSSSSMQPRIACWSLLFLAVNLRFATVATAEDLPDIRPALVGNGPNALINLIDREGLAKGGQKSAALLIWCEVIPNGNAQQFMAYSGTPEADKLKFEVRNKIYHSKFIPAVYNHREVIASFYGTVIYAILDGKPHLRIFANQDPKELEHESNFISPQPFTLPGHIYDRIPYPHSVGEDVPGMAKLSMSVDASGHLKEVHVVSETPPGKKFGETTLKVIKNRTFMPAFRDGRPVDSTTPYNYYYLANRYRLK